MQEGCCSGQSCLGDPLSAGICVREGRVADLGNIGAAPLELHSQGAAVHPYLRAAFADGHLGYVSASAVYMSSLNHQCQLGAAAPARTACLPCAAQGCLGAYSCLHNSLATRPARSCIANEWAGNLT